MMSLLSIFFTVFALIIIPCLFFISKRLNVPFSSTTIPETASSQYDLDKEEMNKKCDTIGENENQRKMPKHVAIILDGNRRWAKKRGLGVAKGHEAGGRRIVELAMDFFDKGINTVSVFAFSTENWGRPEDEINYLMALFEKNFKSEISSFERYKVKISVIGNRANIPQSLLDSIQEAEEATKSYKEKQLIMAIDYSGRFDILQACKSFAEKAKNGVIQVEDIDEKLMDKELMTNRSEFPNPDLLIRTSGEQRISNFFLWQSAYTELYFPNVLWPDFGKAEYLEALAWYQQRQRRFGRNV